MVLKFISLLNRFHRFYGSKQVHKYVFAMDKAYLRIRTDEDNVGTERFEITFHCETQEPRVRRQFNFNRSLNETVGALLGRISMNVEKVANRKRKKKNQAVAETEPIEITPILLENGTEVCHDVSCRQLFGENANSEVTLKLLGNDYRVIINSPWIDGIALPTSFLANFPVYPSKLDAAFIDKDLSEYMWYKSENKKEWMQVGTGFVYYPTNSDINSYIKLQCVPKNLIAEGPSVECVSNNQVEASPGFCPFETRHQFTKEFAKGKEFRVVTYNILADLYCDSDFTRTVLHPYCPPYALSIDYRKQLFVKELIGNTKKKK